MPLGCDTAASKRLIFTGHIMESKDTFVKLMRSRETTELMKEPNAFMLLSQIAFRARRTSEFNQLSLEPGEALIGDHASIGLTRQQYRTALSKLESWKFIATKATTKGTIATIITTSVYDINKETSNHQNGQPATIEQPSANHRATTNKNVNNGKNDNKSTLTIEDFQSHWNSKRHLPHINIFSAGRCRQFKLRLKEKAFCENWTAIVDKLDASKFHTGREPGSSWQAKVDWILHNDTNYVKILELRGSNGPIDKNRVVVPLPQTLKCACGRQGCVYEGDIVKCITCRKK